MVLSFKEFCVKKQLIEQDYMCSEEQLKLLVEAGFFDNFKKIGRNAALAGAIGMGTLGMTGCSGDKCDIRPQEKQTTQQSDSWVYINPDIKRNIVNKIDGTYYIYLMPQRHKENAHTKLAKLKFLRMKATHDFMKETGSNMRGVEWEGKTVDNNHIISIKLSQ
jgi:hypothetical protein